MTINITDINVIHRVILAYANDSDSPYINIPYNTYQNDDTVQNDEVALGPPSMYNDIDEDDRLSKSEDIRRQGIRPYRDTFEKGVLPVTVTVLNEEKTNEQNNPTNDTTFQGARNENRDTIGFNPGEFVSPNEEIDPDQYNNPYLA